MLKRGFTAAMVASLALACATVTPEGSGAGVGTGDTSARPTPPEGFQGNTLSPLFPSLDDLAREFLAALAAKDEARLREISISREEFRDVIWPVQPVARADSGITEQWAWDHYVLRYETGLRRLLMDHGGKEFRLVRVGFTGETEDFGSYTVHNHSFLVVMEPDGRELQDRFFGSVLEQNGGYKIYGYVTR